MSIQVKVKHPIYHPLKVAIFTILAFGIIAVFLRFRSDDETGTSQSHNSYNVSTFGFIPIVELTVAGESESDWSLALSEAIGGTQEATVDFGRVDLLTEDYAIEIDRIDKWKEGIGQALQYAEETGKLPMLALIADSETDDSKIRYIDQFCQKKAIKLVILKRRQG